MTNFTKVVFIASPAVAKITGRYICILRNKSGDESVCYSDDSIVDLAATLGDKIKDWQTIEIALNETGVFSD